MSTLTNRPTLVGEEMMAEQKNGVAFKRRTIMIRKIVGRKASPSVTLHEIWPSYWQLLVSAFTKAENNDENL